MITEADLLCLQLAAARGALTGLMESLSKRVAACREHFGQPAAVELSQVILEIMRSEQRLSELADRVEAGIQPSSTE